MENEDILRLINMHFSILETYGQANIKDLIAILYIMFMSEYYEYYRNISFHDIENSEIGLTDCMVQKLNAMLDCIKRSSNLAQCVNLGEFYTKWHWIIPDDHSDPEPSNPEYIEDGTFHSNGVVAAHILTVDDVINSHILEL